jgi:hypothetical protein
MSKSSALKFTLIVIDAHDVLVAPAPKLKLFRILPENSNEIIVAPEGKL